jgi:hypothetical protein
MSISRRQFAKGTLAGVLAASRASFGLTESGLSLGLNTWSLRDLSGDDAIPTIIQVMKEANLKDCQILFSHVEPEQFKPNFSFVGRSIPSAPPTPQQLEKQRADAAALSQWRLSVPMTYFESIRSKFEGEGIRIKAYAARLGTSDAENDRLFLMTKALGAESINLRIPEPLTNMVAAAADRHQMTVGLQFSDLHLMKMQEGASKYFKLDPDTGDLTKRGINALQFVEENYKTFASIDLKDAVSGGGSVPFGTGEAHLKEVLQTLREKQAPITAYIDCDYPGTGKSTEEVRKCVAYVRQYIS